jgi:hypothetical protein
VLAGTRPRVGSGVHEHVVAEIPSIRSDGAVEGEGADGARGRRSADVDAVEVEVVRAGRFVDAVDLGGNRQPVPEVDHVVLVGRGAGTDVDSVNDAGGARHAEGVNEVPSDQIGSEELV